MSQDAYVPPKIQSSGADLAQLLAGGLTEILRLVIASNPELPPPANQATVSPTGGGSTGGSLPAGTYFASYTYGDGNGETVIGSSRSAAFTVSSGNIPTLTFGDTPPTGAAFRNVYLTLAGGPAGTEQKYVTGVPTTATTVNLSFVGPDYANAPTIPVANTTGAGPLYPPQSQATVNPTGGATTGGSLPAGTYFAGYTYWNGVGLETTEGSSRSAAFTISAGNVPLMTFNDIPPTGALARQVYVTAAGGAAGTEKLYPSTVPQGSQAFTFVVQVPVSVPAVFLIANPASSQFAGVPIGGALPTANTSGGGRPQNKYLFLGVQNILNNLWTRTSDLVSQYASGNPVDFYLTRDEVARLSYSLHGMAQTVDDVLAVMAANPGTIGTVPTIGMPKTTRTFA